MPKGQDYRDNSEYFQNIFQKTFTDIEPDEVVKVSRRYNQIMDAINTSLTEVGDPDEIQEDPMAQELLDAKKRIDQAKEGVMQDGTVMSLMTLQDELDRVNLLLDVDHFHEGPLPPIPMVEGGNEWVTEAMSMDIEDPKGKFETIKMYTIPESCPDANLRGATVNEFEFGILYYNSQIASIDNQIFKLNQYSLVDAGVGGSKAPEPKFAMVAEKGSKNPRKVQTNKEEIERFYREEAHRQQRINLGIEEPEAFVTRRLETEKRIKSLEKRKRDNEAFLRIIEARKAWYDKESMPEVDLKRDKTPEAEMEDFIGQFSQEEQSEMLQAFSESFENPQLEARLNQVFILQQVLNSALTNIQGKRRLEEGIRQFFEGLGDTIFEFGETDTTGYREAMVDRALRHGIPWLTTLIKAHPTQSINQLMKPFKPLSGEEILAYADNPPKEDDADGWMVFEMRLLKTALTGECRAFTDTVISSLSDDSNGDVVLQGVIDRDGNFQLEDVDSPEQVNKQFLVLLRGLRENRDTEAARRIIEDQLLGPLFDQKIEELKADTSRSETVKWKMTRDDIVSREKQVTKFEKLKKEAYEESIKLAEKNQEAWMNPSEEMLKKGAIPCENWVQVDAKRAMLVEKVILHHKLKAAAGKMIQQSDLTGFDA